MQQPQQSTMADEEIRSLRVDCLTPTMDALYLFNCFNDNAEVLAATVLCNVQTGCHEDYGFVEFASHSVADFVLNSYNGELMPNFNNDRYCLSWDTDGFGTRWRWDPAYECCSFFGYDMEGEELDAKNVIELYSKDSIHVVTPYQSCQHPSPSGGFMYIQNNIMHPYDHRNLYYGGYNGYVNYQHHGFYPQAFAYQQLQSQWTTVGSAAHTPRQQTQVPNKRDLKLVCSKEKQREKELYLCFNELDGKQRYSYVFRTIKLSDILACSCEFSFSTSSISQCDNCASKTKPESQLRQRAWLSAEENVPAGCGGKEMRIAHNMGCCASGSHIFFAGGRVEVPDSDPWELLVPSGDVYSFSLESTSWRKLEWSFVKGKPDPLFFEVDGNFYCLAAMHCGHYLEKPTFEFYNSSTGKCEVLPDPPFYHDLRHVVGQKLSYAIVGTKILVSIKGRCLFPIMCFDVNDKEKGWRGMTGLFDGKPFPFIGRALVLDLNGTSDKVMFSFRNRSNIYVSQLVVNVDGDMSISDDQLLLFFGANQLLDNCVRLSYDFIDLGSQRVACVLCGNRCNYYRRRVGIYDVQEVHLQKVRVVVVVIRYGVGSKGLMTDILATRCFEYNCHSPRVLFSSLVGSFVV